LEVLKERVKRRLKTIDDASRWARSLEFRCTAILVGSYARGDFNLWSDVDIILIAEFWEGQNPIERLRLIDHPPGFQVIPLTPAEFKRLLEKGDPMAIESIEIGVKLREDVEIPTPNL